MITFPFLAGLRRLSFLTMLFAGLLCFELMGPLAVQAQETTSDKISKAANETSEAIKDAGHATEQAAQDLWARIDANRLKNRTPDQIVAWIIIGVLVGAITGMFTALRSTGMGVLGRLLLGLAGAFIGGMIVAVANIDFGWGVVIIRYEELVFAFAGALILIGSGRLIRHFTQKKKAVK